MPVYVYRNLNTGETFEVEQRITEAALETDPRTGDPVRRVIQPVGIAFKGSGFYVNDSRGSSSSSSATSSPASSAASDNGATAGDAASGGAGKTDTSGSSATPPSGASTTASSGTASPAPAKSTSSPAS